MYSTRMISKIRKINPRRVFRNRMAGYVSSNNKYRSGMSLLCVLAVLLSVALLSACMDDAAGNGNNTSGTPSDATKVQNAQQNATTDSTITLIWGSPTDITGYEGVTISAEPNAGNLSSAQQLDTSEHTFQVTGLTVDTPYSFTIRTRYSAGGKENSMVVDAQITNNPVDRDDDMLIDINSIEQLNNIRHTLDGSGYRDGAGAVLMQCGAQSDTDCDGYELMRSLDFADATSYASGIVDTALRPNNNDPDVATNSGWVPIGTSNGFNSRFEGNGHTISNLYGRRSSAGQLGLFGATETNAVIRSVGVFNVRLYGSDANDGIGALVGFSDGTTIVASYASGIINGGVGADNIGGLVGTSSPNSTIVASYASGTADGGANTSSESIGGLVGASSLNSTIVASYASGTADGGADNDIVGGLIGRVTGGIIMASYASGNANGGTGNDNVGGLTGGFFRSPVLSLAMPPLLPMAARTPIPSVV